MSIASTNDYVRIDAEHHRSEIRHIVNGLDVGPKQRQDLLAELEKVIDLGAAWILEIRDGYSVATGLANRKRASDMAMSLAAFVREKIQPDLARGMNTATDVTKNQRWSPPVTLPDAEPEEAFIHELENFLENFAERMVSNAPSWTEHGAQKLDIAVMSEGPPKRKMAHCFIQCFYKNSGYHPPSTIAKNPAFILFDNVYALAAHKTSLKFKKHELNVEAAYKEVAVIYRRL